MLISLVLFHRGGKKKGGRFSLPHVQSSGADRKVYGGRSVASEFMDRGLDMLFLFV